MTASLYDEALAASVALRAPPQSYDWMLAGEAVTTSFDHRTNADESSTPYEIHSFRMKKCYATMMCATLPFPTLDTLLSRYLESMPLMQCLLPAIPNKYSAR